MNATPEDRCQEKFADPLPVLVHTKAIGVYWLTVLIAFPAICAPGGAKESKKEGKRKTGKRKGEV